MFQIIKNKVLFFLIIIIILGGFLRLYGINWDQGYHLHPDERAIIMYTIPLSLPEAIDQFLSEESPLNPNFFAYGNFPLYLLKATSAVLSPIDSQYLYYEKINLVGRMISAIADVGTILLVFLIAKKLFDRKLGLFAAFFYAVSVFPVQAAHFYAVDSLLTFFIILTIYQLLRHFENPSIKNSMLVGLFFGLALATKISAAPLLIAIFTAITLDFLPIFIKQPHKLHKWIPHVPLFLKRLFFNGITIVFSTFVTFVVAQPYTLVDFHDFFTQVQQQSRMTESAFTFPFTLQYVGKTPYVYELKNVFFWGLGPVLATLSFLGAIYITVAVLYNMSLRGVKRQSNTLKLKIASLTTFARNDTKQLNSLTVILIFFWIYFLIVGNFAVGWMRYMLPLYPLLCLFAAVPTLSLFNLILNVNFAQFSIFNLKFLFKSKNYNFKNSLKIKNLKFKIFVILVLTGIILIWPISFMHIYTQPNTRVQASEWINQNIPFGSTIAVEHWDDALPLYNRQFYQTLSLELYNAESPLKWRTINQQLSQTDYIIISSNRLYKPLQKLTDCESLPPNFCYPQTANYYKRLFNEELGFRKVAEFAVYPTIPLLNIAINDQGADESFTVYDHPKVMIFKKI